MQVLKSMVIIKDRPDTHRDIKWVTKIILFGRYDFQSEWCSSLDVVSSGFFPGPLIRGLNEDDDITSFCDLIGGQTTTSHDDWPTSKPLFKQKLRSIAVKSQDVVVDPLKNLKAFMILHKVNVIWFFDRTLKDDTWLQVFQNWSVCPKINEDIQKINVFFFQNLKKALVNFLSYFKEFLFPNCQSWIWFSSIFLQQIKMSLKNWQINI